MRVIRERASLYPLPLRAIKARAITVTQRKYQSTLKISGPRHIARRPRELVSSLPNDRRRRAKDGSVMFLSEI